MAMRSTHPLVKMSTRNFPGGKGGRCVRLTTSPPSRVECNEIWEPKPPGTLWATPGLLRESFNFLRDEVVAQEYCAALNCPCSPNEFAACVYNRLWLTRMQVTFLFPLKLVSQESNYLEMLHILQFNPGIWRRW
jgi:hypothetical protein